MGRTVTNNRNFDDDDWGSRKHKKSAGKTKSTKVLNRYVEEDYTDNEDLFDDSSETEYNTDTYDNK